MRSCERKQTDSIWNGDSRWRALVFITNENYRSQRQSRCGLFLVFDMCVTATSGPLCATACPTSACVLSISLRHLSLFSVVSSAVLQCVSAHRIQLYKSYHTCRCSLLVTGGGGGVVVDMDCFSLWRQNSFGLFVNIWNEIRCRGCPENWNHSAVCKNKPQLYSCISSLRKRIHPQERSISAE